MPRNGQNRSRVVNDQIRTKTWLQNKWILNDKFSKFWRLLGFGCKWFGMNNIGCKIATGYINL